MKITIESTDTIATLDGVKCRLWHGVTEDGTPCAVFVHRIAVDEAKQAAFDRELDEQREPDCVKPFRRHVLRGPL